MPLGLVLIGAGMAGARYAEAIGLTHAVDLRGMAPTVSDRAKKLAEKIGCRLMSVDALLSDPTIDLVCVATPNATHTPLAIATANAGKHCILEKPIALNRRDALNIINAYRARGLTLAIPYLRRHDSLWRDLHKRLYEGRLGKLKWIDIEVRAHRSSSYFMDASWRGAGGQGGVLLNQAIHFVDLALWLAGTDQLTGTVATIQSLRHSFEPEDHAIVHTQLAGGCRLSLRADTCLAPNRETVIRLATERGAMEATESAVLHWQFPPDILPPVAGTVGWGAEGMAAIINDTAEAIREGRAPKADGAAGFASLDAVFTMLEAGAR